MLAFALVRAIEVIGEAASKVDTKKMAESREQAAHLLIEHAEKLCAQGIAAMRFTTAPFMQRSEELPSHVTEVKLRKKS